MDGVCVFMLRTYAFRLHAFVFRYICWQVNVGAEGGTDVAQSAGAQIWTHSVRGAPAVPICSH